MSDLERLRAAFWPAGEDGASKDLIDWTTAYARALAALHGEDTPILGHWEPRDRGDHQPTRARLPRDGSAPAEIVERILQLIPGSVDWAHPCNAIAPSAPPTTISLFASLVCDHLAPNLAWDLYGQQFSGVEIALAALVAELVGYDPVEAGGLAVYGGAGAVLYGARAGIERALRATGADRSAVRMLKGRGGHESTDKAAAWLGLNRDSVVEVDIESGRMDPVDLAAKLSDQIERGNVIGCIVAEIGSTFEFELDDLAEIERVCQEVVTKHALRYRPHVHADAAIAGIYAVFDGYDLERNDLNLKSEAIQALTGIMPRVQALRLSQSLGLDFHKLGFTPLTSSLVLFADRNDLQFLGRVDADAGAAPPVWPPTFGSHHPAHFTLEASRSAAGVVAAYANCLLLGRSGYQVLLGHLLELSHLFRGMLEALPYCRVLNAESPGPAVVMRFLLKRSSEEDPAQRNAADEDDSLNEEIFAALCTPPSGSGLRFSMVKDYCPRNGAEASRGPMTVIKGYFVSPFTSEENIVVAIDRIRLAYSVASQSRGRKAEQPNGD